LAVFRPWQQFNNLLKYIDYFALPAARNQLKLININIISKLQEFARQTPLDNAPYFDAVNSIQMGQTSGSLEPLKRTAQQNSTHRTLRIA
tara:strand:- start:1074 stop:1343 length:270 start_codon:yes stop_codon:yes gene_type:complete